MELNARKTKDMWISLERSGPLPPPINIGGTMIERVTKFKFLGVTVQNGLNGTHMYLASLRKQYWAYNLLYQDKTFTAPIWGGLPSYFTEDIERVQKRCLDIIGLLRNIIEVLESRTDKSTCKEYNNIRDSENHSCRRFVCDLVNHKYNLRTVSNPLLAPISNTDRHKQSFISRTAWLEFLIEIFI